MTLELAAIQHDIAWESPTETITVVRPLVLDAAEQGATLISLTEMWACGFSMNTEVVAEPPDGLTATTMHELAEETGCWIAGSFCLLIHLLVCWLTWGVVPHARRSGRSRRM